jgi:hypothetical protein
MEENNKSEKVPFLKIIELLRAENSFLRRENEILIKQIELYRSEIKVNEQRNTNYREKIDHIIKLISPTRENYGNGDNSNENGEENNAGSSSNKASDINQDEHGNYKYDNEKETDPTELKNYEYGLNREENGEQIDEHALQHDANASKQDEHVLQHDEHEDFSKTAISQRDENGKHIIEAGQNQNENDNPNKVNEEGAGRKEKPFGSEVVDSNDNVKQNKSNESVKRSELKTENDNDKLNNDNVNSNKGNVTGKESNVTGASDNEKSANGNEKITGSKVKAVNDNVKVGNVILNIQDEKKREYKVLAELIKNNIKVTFSKKYIKKMMDRYADEMIYFMNHDKVSLNEICRAMGASVSTMIRDLAIFKRKGWIKYHGTAKFGFYRITDEGRKVAVEKEVI